MNIKLLTLHEEKILTSCLNETDALGQYTWKKE